MRPSKNLHGCNGVFYSFTKIEKFTTNRIHKAGKVHVVIKICCPKLTATDHESQIEWKGHKINLLPV